MRQICQLKHFMRFSLFEIATMTGEEREFYLKWYNELKEKEREASSSHGVSNNEPHFGPHVG